MWNHSLAPDCWQIVCWLESHLPLGPTCPLQGCRLVGGGGGGAGREPLLIWAWGQRPLQAPICPSLAQPQEVHLMSRSPTTLPRPGLEEAADKQTPLHTQPNYRLAWGWGSLTNGGRYEAV